MTARPASVEPLLVAQARRRPGGAGADVRRLPLTVVLDDVRSLWNVGSIFRSADACGVSRIVLAGITGCPPRPEIRKTALGADEAVAWRYRKDVAVAVDEERADGFAPVVLEASPDAVPLTEMSWPSKVCLVVGNEVAGVAPALLERCDQRVAIPMLGVKTSLNVAVAFGIAAHAAATALLQSNAAAGESTSATGPEPRRS